MSFTVVSGVNGQYSSAASSTAYAIASPSSTIPVGSFIFGVLVANVASETISSITDNSTQAGAANTYGFNNGLAASGTTLTMIPFWCLKTTRAILATDTINPAIGVAATRRAAVANAWTPSNGNAAFNTANFQGVLNDTSSPVQALGSGTAVSVTDGLAIFGGGELSPTTVPGYALSTTNPAGYTSGVAPVAPSTAPTVVAWMAWKDNAGVTSIPQCDATFTNITRAHAFNAIATDIAVPVRPKLTVVRRSWAGR